MANDAVALVRQINERRAASMIPHLRRAADPTASIGVTVAGTGAKIYARGVEATRVASRIGGSSISDAGLIHLLTEAYRQAPQVLYNLWLERRISLRQLRIGLAEAWNRSGTPNASLPRELWREMFSAAGFTSQGRPSVPVSIRLYRGSTPELRENWSWTDDPGIAAMFAATRGAPYTRVRAWAGWHGCVWTVDAPPESQFMHFIHEEDTLYNQFVIDTEGLVIRLHTSAEELARLAEQ